MFEVRSIGFLWTVYSLLSTTEWTYSSFLSPLLALLRSSYIEQNIMQTRYSWVEIYYRIPLYRCHVSVQSAVLRMAKKVKSKTLHGTIYIRNDLLFFQFRLKSQTTISTIVITNYHLFNVSTAIWNNKKKKKRRYGRNHCIIIIEDKNIVNLW